jgi:peptide/nickel transport system substrate-binding protein
MITRVCRYTAVFVAFVLTAAGGWAASMRICDDVTDPATLNPLQVFSEKIHNIVQQVFDGLVHFSPDGEIEPALAVSWERVDDLTMRFRLRRDVFFHNGEPFDAEAVRWTIERHLDPATGFPGLGFLSTIDRAVVVDPLTVDIITRVPDSLLLRRLAGFVFMVPPKGSLDPNFGKHPIGTGPYQFSEWVPRDRIVLRRNEKYWMNQALAPDGLEFRFVPTERQIDLLLTDELDLVTELPGTATLQVASHPRTQVVKKPSFYTVCATLNVSRGPLKDVRVRRALNHAINKQDLIRYDILGNGQTIASLSMPGEVGHNPDLKPYEYNISQARKLLREAGLSTPVRLKTLTKVQARRTAGIISEQLRAAGIELDISAVTTDADTIKDMASKDIDIGISAFPDVLGHIFFIQSIMLYSKSPFSLHHNQEYDHLLEALVTEMDPGKHEQRAKRLDRLVHEQALSLFTYQRIRTYGVSRKCKFVPSVTGRPHFYRTQMAP